MENSEGRDHLNFKNEKTIKSIIGDEELLFSDKLIKINRYGLSQERNILITNKAIYNLKKKSKIIYYNKYILFIFRFKKTYFFKYYLWNNNK